MFITGLNAVKILRFISNDLKRKLCHVWVASRGNKPLDDSMLGKLPEWLQMTSTAVLGQLNVYVNVTIQPTAQMTVHVVVDYR